MNVTGSEKEVAILFPSPERTPLSRVKPWRAGLEQTLARGPQRDWNFFVYTSSPLVRACPNEILHLSLGFQNGRSPTPVSIYRLNEKQHIDTDIEDFFKEQISTRFQIFTT